jgi:FG-GAP-like repeat
MLMHAKFTVTFALAIVLGVLPVGAEEPWKKHVVHEGLHTNTAVAGDFSGDGKPDIISSSGSKVRLFVAPDWREVILAEGAGYDFIHSELFDVDGDGDLDWIGARYQPGWIVWLEQPAQPLQQRWTLRVVDDQVNGVHGLLKGDIDGDGKFDLIANSAQPRPPFPNSAAWLRVPKAPHSAEHWERFIFADQDAPGLSHYFGVGDVNGDGRPDIALAAKGGPQAEPSSGEWFAWWEAPADRKTPWAKRVIAANQPGATNIQPADINGDGKTDFLATRGHGRGVIWFEAPTWKEHVIHESLLEPHSLVVVDMDGDGDIDAATCAYGDRQAMWFENDGRGRFTNHLVGADQAAYDIRAVDLDLDGDLDLLVAGQTTKNVVWFENPRQ